MKTTTPKAWFENLSERSAALDWKVLLACIGISSLIWLLGSLSSEGEFTLHYEFQASDLPQQCELFDDQNIPIEIFVKSKGISVLSKWVERDKKVIPLPLSTFKCEGKNISIPSRRLLSLITPHLEEGQTLVRISPDTILIPVLRKLVNKIPITLQAENKLPVGLRLESIVFSPDSLPLEGDAVIMNQLKTINTIPFEISDTLQREIALDIPSGVVAAQTSITLKAKAQAIEKLDLELSPTLNVDYGKKEVILLSTCTLSFIGTKEELKRINTNKFSAVLDPTPGKNSGEIRIIGLENLPDGVGHLISPSEMAFLIKE